MIPYRNCKLTKILYKFFHEDKNMAMIVNINLDSRTFEETKKVLLYAALAKQLNPLRY